MRGQEDDGGWVSAPMTVGGQGGSEAGGEGASEDGVCGVGVGGHACLHAQNGRGGEDEGPGRGGWGRAVFDMCGHVITHVRARDYTSNTSKAPCASR